MGTLENWIVWEPSRLVLPRPWWRIGDAKTSHYNKEADWKFTSAAVIELVGKVEVSTSDLTISNTR